MQHALAVQVKVEVAEGSCSTRISLQQERRDANAR
jgi:hypothetical protein